jgi:hypothetical protein
MTSHGVLWRGGRKDESGSWFPVGFKGVLVRSSEDSIIKPQNANGELKSDFEMGNFDGSS